MNPDQLVAVGLTYGQARAYALLIEDGEITPSEVTGRLNITRTNSYKIFDKLVELGLATKQDINKKIVYSPTNPLALSQLVAEQRNIATQREEAVRQVITKLQAKYHSHENQPSVQAVTGRQQVADAFRQQLIQNSDVYFLRSSADIPIMGFDTMHEIRTAPSRFGNKRYGITPDRSTGTNSSSTIDTRSNLERTWVKQEDYDTPVEWSVCGSSLLIVLYADEPHAITINDPLIAESFKQIWKLLNSTLRVMPYYKSLPR